MNFKGKICEKSGITLITLVVTIIILLILAGITIATITSDNGIIKNANDAKEQTEIAEEKEIVDRATIQAMGNNKRGNLVEDELQEQLDKITDSGKTEVSDNGEEFEVVFVDSNRYYTVDKDGNIVEEGKIVIDKSPGDITKDENGDDIEEGQPYEIWCIEDLVAFSNMVNGSGIIIENGKAIEVNTSTNFSNKTVELKTNLNFKSNYSYADSERTDFGDINGNESDGNTLINEMTTGRGFKPIGLNQLFRGTFEGNNKRIQNIYINYEEYNSNVCVGLFSRGHIDTTILNLEISGEIKGNWEAGGIIGANAKEIKNCKNKANITGNNAVGGILGAELGQNVKIINCENYGEINIINKSYAYGGAGGIVGYISAISAKTSSSIENCKNEGKVTGIANIGGIIGTVTATAEIKNSWNKGEIEGAGIVSYVRGGGLKIINSYNEGKCKNGLISLYEGGSNYWELILDIQNSYNLGEVTNAGILGKIGSIAKIMTLNIENTYNAGKSDRSIIGTIPTNDYDTEKILNIKNVYYEENKSNSLGATETGIVKIEIQNNKNFINLLNNNITQNEEWLKWKLGENGYPTFE